VIGKSGMEGLFEKELKGQELSDVEGMMKKLGLR